MKLSELKLNPDNPRNIKPEKLDKLAQSIKDFPKMMVKRPIVYDDNKIIIGGNMRYKAIEKLGMTEIPDEWTSDASDFTPEERQRFIMQDNAEMGEHDWDMVANQYELEDLEAWGIDVPYADSTEGTTCFVWHADSKPELRPLFERSFIGAGFRLSATIIWLKKQASMGFQDYRSRHEPCLYGWKGKREERVKDRTQTTVWESGRDSNYEHPTQKPVFLAANAIANHNPGVVLDLFLGSGSTLIACEQTDRTCYGMELDPKYTDVIRRRYWKFVNNGDETGWEENTPAVDVK